MTTATATEHETKESALFTRAYATAMSTKNYRIKYQQFRLCAMLARRSTALQDAAGWVQFCETMAAAAYTEWMALPVDSLGWASK
jgi:hypothetical protein